MGRGAGSSAETKLLKKEPRAYRMPGEWRYRKAEAELSAAIESTTLPCLLALFKDPSKLNEFERLFEHVLLTSALVMDTASYSGIPRNLYEFVMSQESKKRVQQLIESVAFTTVLLQEVAPDDKLPPGRWEAASLLTRFVALVDLHWALGGRERSIWLQKTLAQDNAIEREKAFWRGLHGLCSGVDKSYKNNSILTGVVQQRISLLVRKRDWPVCIQQDSKHCLFSLDIDKLIARWLEDFTVWSRKYGKWKAQRKKAEEWCPAIWEQRGNREKKEQLKRANVIQESVVKAPLSKFDQALQHAIATEPDIAAWSIQEGYGNLLCAPSPVSWSAQASKKNKNDWVVTYKKIDVLPGDQVWLSPEYSELILDLKDIIYHHWSSIGKPPSFIITDTELFHYRDRLRPDAGERSLQRKAIRHLQQFHFFNKKRTCDGERLLRCIALAAPGRTGKCSEFVYYIEILGLWRGRFEKSSGSVIVSNVSSPQKLWKQSVRKSLVRQLIRYLRAEWRRHARLYVTDKEVRYRSWREHLEQCGLVKKDIEPRPSEFYSSLAIALATLHKEELVKVWYLQEIDGTNFMTGEIYDRSKHSDPLLSLVCNPQPCVGRNGLDAFLEQKIGFVPPDDIAKDLTPVANRHPKSHV